MVWRDRRTREEEEWLRKLLWRDLMDDSWWMVSKCETNCATAIRGRSFLCKSRMVLSNSTLASRSRRSRRRMWSVSAVGRGASCLGNQYHGHLIKNQGLGEGRRAQGDIPDKGRDEGAVKAVSRAVLCMYSGEPCAWTTGTWTGREIDMVDTGNPQ